MNLNIGEGQFAPEDSLSSELDRGDATARALVEHLKRMGATNMHRVVGGFKVSVEPADLPPPHDSQEEAQRAAGNPAGTPGAKIDASRLADASVKLTPEQKAGNPLRVTVGGVPVQDQAAGVRAFLAAGLRKAPVEPAPTAPQSALDEMAAQAASWHVGVDPAHGPDAMAYMLRGLKPSNPKDAVGDTKVPLALCSPIAKAHWALAQHCGRVKYGAWNWREAGARISVYLSAIQRHADGYLSGERLDPTDGTHHLGNIMACCAILLEAEAAGKLTDDRPPEVGMRCTYAEVEQQQAELTKKYADRNPKHWTR